MTDKLTQELENAVERGLAAGQNALGHQRMTGGSRNGGIAGAPTTLVPMHLQLDALADHNGRLKVQLDDLIEGLRRLREEL